MEQAEQGRIRADEPTQTRPEELAADQAGRSCSCGRARGGRSRRCCALCGNGRGEHTVACAIRQMTTAPLAPVGPPPLCTVPRGWNRISAGARVDHARLVQEVDQMSAGDGPWDYGMLAGGLYFAEVGLGYRVLTWEDVARGWSTFNACQVGSIQKAFHTFAAGQIERAGFELSARLPDREWLEAKGAECREWRYGSGRFADGCEFDYPFPDKIVIGRLARVSPEIAEKLRRGYEDVGSPWGRSDFALELYLWHKGQAAGARELVRCRWDGERMLQIGPATDDRAG